jgi:hypothetical protein
MIPEAIGCNQVGNLRLAQGQGTCFIDQQVSARLSSSRYLPPLISKPRLAPAPIEASMAIGVARANEQEQATTRTAAVAMGLGG